jgi:F-type H+/Na+-transporting ATPase subunit alpha
MSNQFSEDYGQVISVGDGFCEVEGFSQVGLDNVIEFGSGNLGMVLEYNDKVAKVLIFKGAHLVKKGELAKNIENELLVPVSDNLLGRIVDPFLNPIDKKGSIESDEKRPMETTAKRIMERKSVDKQLNTGFLVIDSQIPIGLGQRELFVGPKQVGKSDIAASIICNQNRIDSDIVAVYVAVGIQTGALGRRLMQLGQDGVLDRTVLLVAKSNQSSALNYIAPMVGATIAEFFAEQGKNVLIVYDNLARHARFYRQLSLLLEKPSGREAYPGDIFYLHARLLERAGNFNQKAGGGSITALPIVETRGEEATDYITTNLMSITDGHVLFSQSLAHKSISPPIDSGFSVSRIGGRSQPIVYRKFSDKLKAVITQYQEIKKYAGLGTELQSESKENIEIGERFYGLVNQKSNELFNKYQELAIIYLVISKEILAWQVDQMPILRKFFLDYIGKTQNKKKVKEAFNSKNTTKSGKILDNLIKKFKKDPKSPEQKSLKKKKKTRAEQETVSDVLHRKFKQ